MEQVLLKKPEPELELEAEVLEEIPIRPELIEEKKQVEEPKLIKKSLWKLLNKGKYNAKYLEELFSADAARRNIYYRSYWNL